MSLDFFEELISYREERCIRCDCKLHNRECVACKARDLKANDIATAVLLTQNDNGEITDVEEVWIQ